MNCKCCGKEARWCSDTPDPEEHHDCDQIHCDHCGMHYALENEASKNAETFEERKKLMLEAYNGE